MSFDTLSFLVSSCDKYSVCWSPFCHGLQKYWPHHPDKLVFITNFKESPCGLSLKFGDDQGWAKNLLQALNRIKTDYILYAQEDYWIKSPVPQKAIKDYLGYLEDGSADMIRLYPAPGPDANWPADDRLGIIAPDARYRVSLQMALWRKKTLLSLIDPNESPWQFEINGSKRSQVYQFFCVQKRGFGIDYVFTAIVNGYWSVMAYQYADDEEISISFEQLPDKSPLRKIYDYIRSKVYRVKQKLISK